MCNVYEHICNDTKSIKTYSKKYTKFYILSSNCIPGAKVAVNSKGEYLVCEKVNYSCSIGNVKDGLNFESIKNMVDDFNTCTSKCRGCNIRMLCPKCFYNSINESGEMVENDEAECEQLRISFQDTFSKIYSILEMKIDLYEATGLKKARGENYEGIF